MRFGLTLSIILTLSHFSFGQWVPVGHGLIDNDDFSNRGSVFDLEVYNGDLYACGFFDSAGTVQAKSVAKWDGQNWLSIGINQDTNCYGFAWDMEKFNGELFVAGYWYDCGSAVQDDNLGRYDGMNWRVVDSTTKLWAWTSPGANNLQVWNGKLYITGYNLGGIAPVDSPINSITYRGPIAYNGFQYELPQPDPYLDSTFSGPVWLETFQNKLISFNSKNCYEYDGQSWFRIPWDPNQVFTNGYTMVNFNDKLYSQYVAWDGQDTFQLVDPIYSGFHIPGCNYLVHQDILYTLTQYGIKMYDTLFNSAFLGDTLGSSLSAYSIAIFNNEVYVGGWFSKVLGIQMNSIMKWTGPLPSGSLTGFDPNSSKGQITLFPNPVNDKLNIKLPVSQIDQLESRLWLVDLNGRVVKSEFLKAEHSILDLSKINPGIYFAKIEVNGELFFDKIIKK